MNKLVKIVLLIGSLAAAQGSMAGEWSAGVIGGQGRYSFDDLDDRSVAFGLNVAYNFDEIFGVEAGYVDLGDFDFGNDDPLANSVDFSVDASALYVAGTGSLALTDRWSLTGRLGIYEPDVTFKVAGVGDFDDSDADSDLYAGVSVDYSLSNNWTAQLRYDDFDIDVTSLGLKYTFR